MKKFSFIIFSALMLLFAVSCSSSASTQIPKEEVTALINSGNFTFMAERAHPTNLEVVNILNSMPGGGASRAFELDYGYTIEMTAEELKVELPYYGRAFVADPSSNKNSYRFTSKDFTVAKAAGKKNRTVFTISPSDVTAVRTIYMEVFPSGKAHVSIDSNERQPISYSGYIMKNMPAK